MPLTILSFPEAAVPAELRQQMLHLQREAWPGFPVPDDGRPVHDPALDPVSMLLVDAGRVLAALDILSKDIDVAGQRLAACGLSTVVTAAEERGRGHGHALVVAARDAMAAGGSDLAIFTCDAELVSFYKGCGFAVVPGAVLVGGTADDPFPSGADKVVLATSFTDRARAIAPRLVQAEIILHPGTIDRLW